MTKEFSPSSLQKKISTLNIKVVDLGFPDVTHLTRIRVKKAAQTEAQNWCQAQFDDEWVWSCPFYTDYADFYFKSSADALAFSLKFADSLAT